MRKIIPVVAAILIFAACKKDSVPVPVTDNSLTDVVAGIDANYSYVKIGNQKWMTTNLVVSRYRNGDKIPHVKDSATWANLATGAWCWYKNDSATYAATYGKLYNWYAVNDPRGLAPTGWHVPSDAEWDTLSTHLGNNAGGKLKDTGTIEAGTGLWRAPNYGATNHSGFTALPGGGRTWWGKFGSIGFYGYWWSSTKDSTYGPLARFLSYAASNINWYPYKKAGGMSVRCIKD